MEHSFDSVGVQIEDENLLATGEDVLNQIKAASYRVVEGYDLPDREEGFEHLWQEQFQQLEPVKREKAKAGIREIGESSRLRQEHFGRFADLDLRSPDTLIDVQASQKIVSGLKRYENLLEREADILISDDLGRLPFEPVVREWRESDNLHFEPRQDYRYGSACFVMDKVHCVDETGWDLWGSDEIYMGGICVDETGDVRKIPVFNVSNDFDTGETVDFRPDRNVYCFNVREGGDNWPKKYWVQLIMMERDWGNFPEWLEKLYRKARDKVKEYVEKYVSSQYGEVLGWLAGWLVGWLLNQLLGWIKGLWADDLIEKETYTLTHVGPRATFGGAPHSSVTRRNYYGGTGKYWVYSYWHLR